MTKMTTEATRRGLEGLEKVFERVRADAGELGLALWLWDAQGEPLDAFQPTCEFCRVVSRGDHCDRSVVADLVARVIQSEERAQARGAYGCCLAALPVWHRRRLIGVAVASFCVREMLDEEAMARMCDRAGLDRQATEPLLRACCRHDLDEAEYLMTVLDRLLQNEQAVQVAQDELASLSANLTVTYEELSVLYTISSSMKLTQQPQDFLKRVCDELLEVMNVEAVLAVSHAERPADVDLVVRAGTIDLDDATAASLVKDLLPRVVQAGRAVVDNRFAPASALPAVRNLVSSALVTEQGPIGMLLAVNKKGREFDSADAKLLGSIVNQSSVFLANHRLYADLQDLLMGVLHALTATIDAKDPYTCGHSQRVARVSRCLAEKIGFAPAKVQQIYLAGLLHDIGKIGIPEKTLRKEGRLTDEEYKDMKRHPVLGAKILGGIRQLEKEITGIMHHHERLDGKGYPYGLKGDELPMEARIVGLADSFDAMTSDRTYRKALSLETVVKEIRDHAGTQFDPKLVDILLSMDLESFLQEIRQEDGKVFPFSLDKNRR
ncbi:MAG TPA: HD domain-containing protein [Phycisphaerae bacterium]|nr:HD domain-containing protein [Phycisphaerae bacterium]HQL76177.1 HD domain-containing protein [Phycisphaerae bacterium]